MPRNLPPAVLSEPYHSALAGKHPLESLKKAPKRVRKLWKGQSKKRLRRQPTPGAWSAHQVVAHLCDAEVMFGARLRFIVAMDRPTIVGWDENLCATRLPHEAASTAELHEGWAALRALNLALLERLAPEAWSRVGLHSERGEESLSKLVHLHAAHDLVHEAQIARTLAARRKPAIEGKPAQKARKDDGDATRAKGAAEESKDGGEGSRKSSKKELKRAMKQAEKAARKAKKAAKDRKEAQGRKAAKEGKPELAASKS
ncbi:MAG: DinB family protein [Planctomycetia bacterium]